MCTFQHNGTSYHWPGDDLRVFDLKIELIDKQQRYNLVSLAFYLGGI